MRIGGVKQSVHVAMSKLILLVIPFAVIRYPQRGAWKMNRLSIVCALAPAVEMATGKGTISRRGSIIASGRWTLHEIGRASDLGPCHTEKCCRRVASFARPRCQKEDMVRCMPLLCCVAEGASEPSAPLGEQCEREINFWLHLHSIAGRMSCCLWPADIVSCYANVALSSRPSRRGVVRVKERQEWPP
jgi:hypothetical protein